MKDEYAGYEGVTEGGYYPQGTYVGYIEGTYQKK
jgi:hypothetical protein